MHMLSFIKLLGPHKVCAR